MKRVFLGLAVALALASAADKKQMFTGLNSDTTCGAKHAMNIRPDDKSVRECVTTDPKKWKYALLVEPEIFALSDQRTPGTFAGQRVTSARRGDRMGSSPRKFDYSVSALSGRRVSGA